ncbi:MAG: hypothetical protein R3C58_02650 [Parvularculaceae bacterium]
MPPPIGWKLIDAAARYPDAAAFGSTQIMRRTARSSMKRPATFITPLVSLIAAASQTSVETLPPEGECLPCAAAMLIRRDRFLEIGGFYEPFFCYSEDVDFGFRLRLQGGWCVQVKDAVVYHEWVRRAGPKKRLHHLSRPSQPHLDILAHYVARAVILTAPFQPRSTSCSLRSP